MTDDSEQERWTDEEREFETPDAREGRPGFDDEGRPIGTHWCPNGDKVRRYASVLCSLCHPNMEPEPKDFMPPERLRGGEGERCASAARINSRLGDALHPGDNPLLWLESHVEQKPDGPYVRVARQSLRRCMERIRRVIPDGFFSPTDGEEGPGYGCRICERPTDGVTICRYCDRMMQAAAPDTEGREAALVKASEFHEGPYTHLAHRGDGEAVCGVEVVAWGDEPDPDAAEPICAECLRQIPRPEEAGGEDEGPVVTIRGRNYTDPDDCPHDRIWMDLTGTGTISCRDCGVVLYNRYGPDADRLRGAPEGRGCTCSTFTVSPVRAEIVRDPDCPHHADPIGVPQEDREGEDFELPDEPSLADKVWAIAEGLDAHYDLPSWVTSVLRQAESRLRGAPEGAGELLHEAAKTADWAVDLIEMYDEKLLDMGEPEEKVRSEIHLAGLRKARRVRDRLYEASRLRTGREERDDG